MQRLKADRLLSLLYGWNSPRDIPHESTFSRVFAEFARTELPQRFHEALVLKTQSERLVGRMARDSTAIEAREGFASAPAQKPVRENREGRPRKGDHRCRTSAWARQIRARTADRIEWSAPA